MIVKIEYVDGVKEEFECKKLECDGDVFILHFENQEDIIIPYGGIAHIDY